MTAPVVRRLGADLTPAELLAWAPRPSIRLRLEGREWPWLDWIGRAATLRAVYGCLHGLRGGW